MAPWADAGLGWRGAAEGTDAAGDDLQTDVMRFMAMLGLCLVAIFALVQSLPLSPTPPVSPSSASAATVPSAPSVPCVVTTGVEVAAGPAVPAAAPSPATAEVAPAPADVRPAHAAATEAAVATHVPDESPADAPISMEPAPRRIAAVRAHDPAPEPRPVTSPPQPLQPVPSQSQPSRGFVLQFDSDAALLHLVGRGEVSLYAIDAEGAATLAVGSGGRLRFAAASAPRRLHEMTAASVPPAVRTAYVRATGRPAAAVTTWGVVLPTRIAAEVDALVRRHDGGRLHIAGDGSVALD